MAVFLGDDTFFETGALTVAFFLTGDLTFGFLTGDLVTGFFVAATFLTGDLALADFLAAAFLTGDLAIANFLAAGDLVFLTAAFFGEAAGFVTSFGVSFAMAIGAV